MKQTLRAPDDRMLALRAHVSVPIRLPRVDVLAAVVPEGGWGSGGTAPTS